MDDVGRVLLFGPSISSQHVDAGAVVSGAEDMFRACIPVLWPASHVACGENATCAQAASGEWKCLGEHRLDGDDDPNAAHVLPTANIVDVELGPTHDCVRTRAGDVYCWGANDAGQCGLPLSVKESRTPSKVAGSIAQVSIEGASTWMRRNDGTVLVLGEVHFRVPGVVVRPGKRATMEPWNTCEWGCFAPIPVVAPFPKRVAKLLWGPCARLTSGEKGCLDYGLPRASPSGGGICDDAWCPWDDADEECVVEEGVWRCGKENYPLN